MPMSRTQKNMLHHFLFCLMFVLFAAAVSYGWDKQVDIEIQNTRQ